MKAQIFVVSILLASGHVAAAQEIVPPRSLGSNQTGDEGVVVGPGELAQPAATTSTVFDTSSLSQRTSTPFFKVVGQDFKSFFSLDTAKFVGAFAVAGAAASHWDTATVEDARERVPTRAADVGNIGGSLAMHVGAGAALFLIGRTSDKPQLVSVGGDLIRAQILSQIVVQGAKLAAGRQRPDGSDSYSFPSGHSASAFATATVLQEHFGWKAGVPAFAFAGFVATSRMASNKHYLSDVLIGAGIGIASGRTIALPIGPEKFAISAAPTQGGAMVTFTRH